MYFGSSLFFSLNYYWRKRRKRRNMFNHMVPYGSIWPVRSNVFTSYRHICKERENQIEREWIATRPLRLKIRQEALQWRYSNLLQVFHATTACLKKKGGGLTQGVQKPRRCNTPCKRANVLQLVRLVVSATSELFKRKNDPSHGFPFVFRRFDRGPRWMSDVDERDMPCTYKTRLLYF